MHYLYEGIVASEWNYFRFVPENMAFSPLHCGQTGIKFETKVVIYQKLESSMLTGFQVSSMECKCVCYRPDHNAQRRYWILKVLKCRNEINLQIELKKQMKKMDHMCAPRAMVIKMSNWLFFGFSVDVSKSHSQFKQNN